ncbi:M48 family metalloprotease [Sinorhizobium saheli]|uniref:M48 family metalloprotease n=1 Tax=Sinorhizobium saheli TaxID=36856 RepID=UPI00129633B8|nr:M48 family metalloprotease [Sinorhizobium saheli]MQW85967.1 M48 family metalloprotease [Sinorhizobium saheli]
MASATWLSCRRLMTRLAPHGKSYLKFTVLRAVWLAINSHAEGGSHAALAWIPWPWAPFQDRTGIAWGVDLLLAVCQVVSLIKAAYALAPHYFPKFARAADLNLQKPRPRSWGPTALLLSGLVILSCCVIGWLIAMSQYGQWISFENYIHRGGQIPLLVGVSLSVLGFLFGHSSVARAAGEVRASFDVVTVPDDHWLARRVHAITEKLNLPKPAVGHTNVTNAFAMGADRQSAMVVIGNPLFALEQDELDAIIGHELGHVLYNDVQRMQFAEGFQQMLGKVAGVTTFILAILVEAASKGENTRQRRANARMNRDLTMAVGNLVRTTLFVGSEMVVKGISRDREFHADAVGAQVTSTDAMVRALKRIHGVPVKASPEERQYGYLMFRGGGFGNLFSTHPTLNARVKALESRARLAAATHEPDVIADAAVEDNTGIAAVIGPSPASSSSILSVLRAKARRLSAGRIAAAFVGLAALTGFTSWNWMQITAATWPTSFPHPTAADQRRITELEAQVQTLLSRSAKSAEMQTLKQAVASLRLEQERLQGLVKERDHTIATLKAQQAPVAAPDATANKENRLLIDAKNRIAELEAQVARLPADPAQMPDNVEMEFLRKSVESLRSEQKRLQQLVQDRDRTIAALRTDPANGEATQRIADLEQQVSKWNWEANTEREKAFRAEQQVRNLQASVQQLETQLTSRSVDLSADDPASWLAAAVDRNGLVQAIANQTTRKAAESIALKLCGGSASGCQLVDSYQNACFALSRPLGQKVRHGNWWHGVAPNWEDAERHAVRECEQVSGAECSVRFTTCSPARLAKPE